MRFEESTPICIASLQDSPIVLVWFRIICMLFLPLSTKLIQSLASFNFLQLHLQFASSLLNFEVLALFTVESPRFFIFLLLLLLNQLDGHWYFLLRLCLIKLIVFILILFILGFLIRQLDILQFNLVGWIVQSQLNYLIHAFLVSFRQWRHLHDLLSVIKPCQL